MTHSHYFIKILFIVIYIIKPSLGYGFYSPAQLPFNDSSISVFGVNIEDQHIFATTNRNGVLHLEIFEVTGSGSDAFVSLVEINYLGLDLTGTLVHLSTANNNVIIIGYATGSTTATAAIYERNTTDSQWNKNVEFNMVTRYASILSETQIIYSSTPDWGTTMSSIGYYLKQDDTWIRVDLASFTIPQSVAAYRNGTIIAANKDDKTVRIFEQVDGNFTQVQQLVPAQDASDGAGQVWGGIIFFLNDNEFYLGNVDAQFTTVPLYLHHFVRMGNGTWDDVAVIESQYMFQSPVALYHNLIVSAGTFSKSKEKLLFLVDMQTFNGTNAQAPISFAYAPVYPTDGAVHASDTFLTAIDQDKKVQFFAINPICGNGIKEENEPCDSGPNCSSFCSCKNNLTRAYQPLVLDCAPICGNGYLDANEECDAYFSDSCQANCTCQRGFEPTGSTACQAICGNGVINEGELCDPGLNKNCNNSCSGCSSGYTLFNYTCMTDQIQIDSPTAPPLSSTDDPDKPDYIIPVAVVVPAVVVAGVIVLVVLLLKKRKAEKRKDEEHQNLANDHDPDQKYIPLTVAQSLMPLPFTAAPSKPNLAPSKSSISSVPEKRLDIPFKDLTLQQEIGAGAFGKVFLGEWQKVQVALKFSSVGDSDEFKQEAKLMIDLRPHPNVVQVLGLCTDSPFPILILEYCDGGSLDSAVKKHPLTDEQIIDYAFGIARGMLHLHLNNIVHRDLAARNILLNDGVPKISDFGMARFVEQYKEGTTASTVGPLKWMAPESLAHQTYGIKSDMWSFGCILYEIVTGQDLYEDIQPIDIYHGVTRGQLRPPVPDSTPMVIKSIMKKCFEFDPEERPTFEEVCNRLREYSQIQTVNSLAVQRSSVSLVAPSE